MAKLLVNNVIVEEWVAIDTPVDVFADLYPNATIEVIPDAFDKKQQVQHNIAAKMANGDRSVLALSLAGKTSNALSGSLNILMQVLGGLAQAQTLADVRNAVAPASPLMTQVKALMEAGEIMSVQYAQNMNDEDAIIEGLKAMTQAAKIIKAQQTQAAPV